MSKVRVILSAILISFLFGCSNVRYLKQKSDAQMLVNQMNGNTAADKDKKLKLTPKQKEMARIAKKMLVVMKSISNKCPAYKKTHMGYLEMLDRHLHREIRRIDMGGTDSESFLTLQFGLDFGFTQKGFEKVHTRSYYPCLKYKHSCKVRGGTYQYRYTSWQHAYSSKSGYCRNMNYRAICTDLSNNHSRCTQWRKKCAVKGLYSGWSCTEFTQTCVKHSKELKTVRVPSFLVALKDPVVRAKGCTFQMRAHLQEERFNQARHKYRGLYYSEMVETMVNYFDDLRGTATEHEDMVRLKNAPSSLRYYVGLYMKRIELGQQCFADPVDDRDNFKKALKYLRRVDELILLAQIAQAELLNFMFTKVREDFTHKDLYKIDVVESKYRGEMIKYRNKARELVYGKPGEKQIGGFRAVYVKHLRMLGRYFKKRLFHTYDRQKVTPDITKWTWPWTPQEKPFKLVKVPTSCVAQTKPVRLTWRTSVHSYALLDEGVKTHLAEFPASLKRRARRMAAKTSPAPGAGTGGRIYQGRFGHSRRQRHARRQQQRQSQIYDIDLSRSMYFNQPTP